MGKDLKGKEALGEKALRRERMVDIRQGTQTDSGTGKRFTVVI